MEEEEVLIGCEKEPEERSIFIVMGMCVSIVGSIFNFLLLAVFRLRKKYQWSLYLLFLAVLDAIFCVSYLILFGLLWISVVHELIPLYDSIKVIQVPLFHIGKTVQMMIPYVLIATSAEKFACMVEKNIREWWWARLRILQRVGRAHFCITILVCCIAAKYPSYYSLTIKHMPNCTYLQSKVLYSTDAIDSDDYRLYDLAVNSMHTIITFCVLFLLNGLILFKLRRSHLNARRNSSLPNLVLSVRKRMVICMERREHKRLLHAIKTTSVVLTSYLICNFLNTTLYVVETQFNHLILDDSPLGFPVWYFVLSEIGSITYVLASAIRFFIYYRYNPDVKNALLAMCCAQNVQSKLSRSMEYVDVEAEKLEDPDTPPAAL